MDPNLIKIKDACIDDITKGRHQSFHATKAAIYNAEDYLNTILGTNYDKIDRELNEFKRILAKELANK